MLYKEENSIFMRIPERMLRKSAALQFHTIQYVQCVDGGKKGNLKG